MQKIIGTTALLLFFAATATPAIARPPTIMNSPGYDARLAESRKALQAAQPAQQNLAPAVLPTPPIGKPRRKHAHPN
jgi:hypothetical protein